MSIIVEVDPALHRLEITSVFVRFVTVMDGFNCIEKIIGFAGKQIYLVSRKVRVRVRRAFE